MTYSFTATTHLGFEEAVARTKEAFKDQGFGVLTEIDIQATLREKIGAETEPYVILGACNPAFAGRALAADPGVGVFLPCNVVVRRSGEDTVIEAMDPTVMQQFFADPAMAELIGEVAPRVRKAVAELGGGQ
ncbi:MAG TPA: DUF302 domain-containing protein [Acidimicrobiales bacterium]|nr:DUF302 domain-containing protein [Acidimicrobiales bacterium]